jgi:iron(III) transport system permease protein
MTRAGLASMVSVPTDVEAAGRTLGATFGRNLRRVVLPLAAPGLLAGAAMTLLLCLGEFVVSVMLFVPDNVPISVAILQARRARDFQTAAMYGGVLLMMSVGLLALRAAFRRRTPVAPVPVATG